MKRKKKTNNDRLRELMKKHGLSRADVCRILNLAVTKGGQTPAVTKWLASPSDPGNYRAMPDLQLEMLEIKLGVREVELFTKET